MFKSYSIIDIPINKLVHDNREVHAKEGYGGSKVQEWPIYKFYRLYHSGKKRKAENLFEGWYIEQYQKYSEIDKTRGGMKSGSLDSLYKNMLKSKNAENFLKEAVKKRVNQRFELLENIRVNGYMPDYADPVQVIGLGHDKFRLFGGHHRVASLAVLGYSIVPSVFLFRNEFFYRLYRYQKKF